MRGWSIVVVAVVAASPALARDRTAYTAIAGGDLHSAEATLSAERAIFPRRPEVLLNLAAVYARTDRAAQARQLYDDVLTSEPVALQLADGRTTSSHDIAERGLLRLASTMAAR